MSTKFDEIAANVAFMLVQMEGVEQAWTLASARAQQGCPRAAEWHAVAAHIDSVRQEAITDCEPQSFHPVPQGSQATLSVSG